MHRQVDAERYRRRQRSRDETGICLSNGECWCGGLSFISTRSSSVACIEEYGRITVPRLSYRTKHCIVSSPGEVQLQMRGGHSCSAPGKRVCPPTPSVPASKLWNIRCSPQAAQMGQNEDGSAQTGSAWPIVHDPVSLISDAGVRVKVF